MTSRHQLTDGSEWDALAAKVNDLCSELLQTLEDRPGFRDEQDARYVEHLSANLLGKRVYELEALVEDCTVISNSLYAEEDLSVVHDIAMRVRRSNSGNVVEMVTTDTLMSRRILLRMVHLTTAQASHLWDDLIAARPKDAKRITRLVMERQLTNFASASAILDEMDKQHPALSSGAL
jgi:hypothetical protein